jgi:perosamine synthetase
MEDKLNDRIPVAEPVFSDAEADAVYEVLKSGWVTMGPKVEAFETAFAAYVGAKHAVAMFNGTITLHALLAALDIGPEDEVIVPTLTYISTPNVVMYQNAKLCLCECDPKTYNVRVEDLQKVVTPRTKAIVSVDMNGLPINYGPVADFAKKHGIHLIADSAESLGGKFLGQQIGTQALAHSFSFFGNKNITTGEGGMVTTNDDWLAGKLRILRNQGQQGRYNHTHLGFNYRMTEMQAAIGIIQLAGLEKRLDAKRRIVRWYNDYFSETDLIIPPHIPDNVDHAWYMYPPSFDESVDRDKVVRALAAENIETRTSFPPVHIQPYYKERFSYKADDYPISVGAWQQLINLPISPLLKEHEVKRVAEATLSAVEKSR